MPEFAAGWVTANPCNGGTRNPYDHRLTVGGSSGGSASAVASYMCAIAVTEDTGGSTRVPATSCGNYGYDPSRNHFPNAGNPGMSYTQDQLGINTRSVEVSTAACARLAHARCLSARDDNHFEASNLHCRSVAVAWTSVQLPARLCGPSWELELMPRESRVLCACALVSRWAPRSHRWRCCPRT